MANKNLRTRQKATFRLELSPRQQKPRNPPVAAHLRAAGPHRKSASGLRQQQQRALKKILGGSGNE